jgi:SAM-dependent methyltransferase
MSRAHRSAVPARLYQATWGRVFARIYDTAFVLAERRGLRDVRAAVVGQAAGSVVELGAGTGLNVRHYRDTVTSLVLTEPDPHMAAKLRRRAAAGSLPVEAVTVVEAPAERLPFEDGSVDTVVSTLVLCTVDDPDRALSEVARVLRPGGSFIFAEHVRAASLRAAGWQDRLNRPWGWYACGCQCNRDTVSSIRGASFAVGELRRDRLRWISPLVRPIVVGSATPAPRRPALATGEDEWTGHASSTSTSTCASRSTTV